MQEQAYEQLTLFPEDSPASPSVWLESKKRKKTIVTYGLKCCELSENLRRVGLSVRTYLESCVLLLPTLYRTWSVKAITSSCLILKLRLSEHRTGGSVSRLLPTEPQLWRTPTANDAKNSTLPPSQLKRDELTSQLMRTLYPTPTTGAGLCGGTGNYQQLKKKEQDGEITPEECRSMAAGNGGQLNPDWVEAMMGFPVGWTALETDG